MGVYVPFMEMPHSCLSTTFKGKTMGYFECIFAPVCPVLRQAVEDSQKGALYSLNVRERRLDDCPLKDVKVPHGKLVDVNRIQRVDHIVLVSALENAKAVIESEEGED